VNRRLLAGLAAATMLVVALPAGAATRPTGRVDLVLGDAVYGDLLAGGGDPTAVAARALAAYDQRLGVDASRFRFDTVRHSLIGTHVRGAEVRDGVRVDGTHALVTIAEGRVIQVAAYGSDLPGAPVARPVPAALAVAKAHAFTGVTRTIVPSGAERLLVPLRGRLVDAYRVGVLGYGVAVTYDVSAADGRVLALRDENKHIDGEATVFLPNPIVTARKQMTQAGVDTGLGPDVELPSADIDKQLRTVKLEDLNEEDLAAGKLTGPWADVVGPSQPSLDGKFAFKSGDPRFETTMAYAHVDRIQRYFQSLGFTPKRETGVNDEPQLLVTVRVEGFDNSFYQPANDVIVFGTGGVDDAEDAEVIIHEYGHAVQDAQVKGWGSSHEGGSMGEGFGDFLAAAYYARGSKGYGDLCVADWDATSYSSSNPPCLRRMDSKKQYPKDMEQEVHADGELWAAYLWRLRQKLGSTAVSRSDNSLKLVLTSHELLTPDADFADAIAALRVAAKRLGKPTWASYVDSVAKQTKMPYRG
jgi:hypothetical protein